MIQVIDRPGLEPLRERPGDFLCGWVDNLKYFNRNWSHATEDEVENAYEYRRLEVGIEHERYRVYEQWVGKGEEPEDVLDVWRVHIEHVDAQAHKA